MCALVKKGSKFVYARQAGQLGKAGRASHKDLMQQKTYKMADLGRGQSLGSEERVEEEIKTG